MASVARNRGQHEKNIARALCALRGHAGPAQTHAGVCADTLGTRLSGLHALARNLRQHEKNIARALCALRGHAGPAQTHAGVCADTLGTRLSGLHALVCGPTHQENEAESSDAPGKSTRAHQTYTQEAGTDTNGRWRAAPKGKTRNRVREGRRHRRATIRPWACAQRAGTHLRHSSYARARVLVGRVARYAASCLRDDRLRDAEYGGVWEKPQRCAGVVERGRDARVGSGRAPRQDTRDRGRSRRGRWAGGRACCARRAAA